MMRMTASLVLPLLAGAAVLTAGCAASAGADPANPSGSVKPSAAAPSKPSIVGSQWRLKSDPQAWFRVQGSNISGNDSCNSLTGSAASLASADRVDFGNGVASTMMYCPDPKGTQTAISEALKGVRIWSRNGAELVLTDPDNNRSWTFVLTPAGSPSASATPSTSAATSAPATSAAPSASATSAAPATTAAQAR